MKRALHSRLVLQPVDPRRRQQLIVLQVVLLLTAVLAAYLITRHVTMGHFQQRLAENENLQKELSEVLAERDLLERRLALAQRNEQITRRSNDQLRETLADIQRRYTELEDEIGFFHDLARASAEQRDLTIHQVAVTPGARDGVLRLRVALTQGLEQSDPVQGRLMMELHGVQDDESVVLALPQLRADPGSGHPDFHFRYFQQVIQDIRLPEGFRPQQLHVALNEGEGESGSELLRRVYDWHEIIRTSDN